MTVEMPPQIAAPLHPSLLPIIHQWKGCLGLRIFFFHLHPLGRALITTLPRNSLAKTLIHTAALANIFGAKDGFWALANFVRIISPPPLSAIQLDDPKKTDLCGSDSPKTYECHQLSNLYCCAYLSAVRYAFLPPFPPLDCLA